MENIVLREFIYLTDYESVITLWKNAGTGIRIQRSDTLAEIQKKITRDPDLFLLACLDNEIVGTVIGGFDGRRGMIYHLAVKSEFRTRGIASLLMEEIESRLISKGCIRCYLFVTPDNKNSIQFYEKRGWEKMTILPYGKDLVK